jgi:hypothetical protein
MLIKSLNPLIHILNFYKPQPAYAVRWLAGILVAKTSRDQEQRARMELTWVAGSLRTLIFFVWI